MAEEVAVIPRLQLAVRTREGNKVLWDPATACETALEAPPSEDTTLSYSFEGNAFAAFDSSADTVTVYDTNTGKTLQCVESRKVQTMCLSPKGTYLVTWKRNDRNDEPNCHVWEVASGNKVLTIVQVRWPAILWSADEKFTLRLVKTGAHLLDNSFKMTTKIENPKLKELTLAPSTSPMLAAFTSGSKGAPSNVSAFKLPDVSTAVCTKAFFKCDSCDMLWNSTGSGMLIIAKTDADDTGKSYYGQSQLYLMTPKTSESVNIKLGNDLPLHDVQWAPHGNEFIVVYGDMPNNLATLYNLKATPIFEFGVSPRNTVCWAPNSRFIALAGFGNLAGEVQFWDRKNFQGAQSKAKIGECKVSSCTWHSWSPCSNYFLTATTAPRMRVDNKIIMWKCNGVQVFKQDYGVLYQALWKPDKPNKFPKRDPSPPPPLSPSSPTASTTTTTSTSSSSAPKPATKGAYRAPGTSSAYAELMRYEKRTSAGGGYSGNKSSYVAPGYVPGAGGIPGASSIPGAAGLVPKPKADKKKKDKEKKKDGDNSGNQKKQEKKKDDKDSPPEFPDLDLEEYRGKYPTRKDMQKRNKSLKSKLNSIETLREKEESSLDKAQSAKLDEYIPVKKELEAISRLLKETPPDPANKDEK